MTQYVAQFQSGVWVRWRALTWQEYRKFKFLHAADPVVSSNAIYEAVLVVGPGLEECPAGIPLQIAEQVMASPFDGSPKNYPVVAEAIATSRDRVQGSYMMQARAMVCYVFKYRPEELDQMDAGQFFERVAMAELITGKQLNPKNPNETPADDGRFKHKKSVAAPSAAQAEVMRRTANRGR